MSARITLANVNVHLGARHVLHDVSWSLEPATHWAIVGPNGSGKSTLLRVIAGSVWIDADGGIRRYSYDGIRNDAVARALTWIRHVSAEQHERYARLNLPISGREVIESGFDNELYVHRAPAAADAARVDALIEAFGLAAIARAPIRELSSGQMRRLLIARALAGAPRVLVLDEFTNGLDRESRRSVLDFLDRIAPDVALIVASHRPDDFPAAITHTAAIGAGRIIASGRGRPARPARSRPGAVATNGPGSAAALLLRIRHADVYRGRKLVLENVNFDLRQGQHTALRGPNGAGKTTFAGLIAGTISAATGAEIVRFGQTGPFDIWKLKERVAHVSDDLQIAYDLGESVEAVVASGFPASIGLFVEPSAAQRATVSDVLSRIGLDALRGRAFSELSFGERRKVLIARSLVRRPSIFILDEIWNGLDADFRIALRSLIEEMAFAGTTIVAVAHEDDALAGLLIRTCSIENRTVFESTSG